MSRANTHVVASINGGWSVRTTGSGRAEKIFVTKDEAVRYGRQVARHRGSELVIHRKDGLVSERSSYGNDPNPPRDKK